MSSCRGHGWDHRVDGGGARCHRCHAGGGAFGVVVNGARCHRRMQVVVVVYKHADVIKEAGKVFASVCTRALVAKSPANRVLFLFIPFSTTSADDDLQPVPTTTTTTTPASPTLTMTPTTLPVPSSDDDDDDHPCPHTIPSVVRR